MAIAVVLSLIFGPLAATMAFLITYDEYRRHFPERGRALRAGFELAALTFAVFLLLSFGAVAFMGWMAK